MLVRFKALLDMVAKLRSKNGCPWDREQTIESMRKHILEEAEEVSEAIESGDHEDISEEMGDLLLVILMISQIAEEEGKFDMGDVMGKVAEKVLTRHTWVFGTDKAETAEDALRMWKENKAKEKAKKKKK